MEKWKKPFWDHVTNASVSSLKHSVTLLFISYSSLHRSRYRLKMILIHPTLLKLHRRDKSHKMWFFIFCIQASCWLNFEAVILKWHWHPKKYFYQVSKLQDKFYSFNEEKPIFLILKCQHYVWIFWLYRYQIICHLAL